MTKTMMIKMSTVEGDLGADDHEVNVITNTTTWLQWQQYDYNDNNIITTSATIWSQWQHLLRLHRHLSVHLNGSELDGNGQTSSSCIVVVMTIIMVDYNTCTMTVFNNLITMHSKDKPAGPVLWRSWQWRSWSCWLQWIYCGEYEHRDTGYFLPV